MSSDVRFDDGPGQTVTLDHEDAAYEVLSHPRRTVVCSLLLRCERLAVDDLVSHIVARETGEPLADVPAGTVEDVHVDLYHRHLPKLENGGLVTWNPGDGDVALAPDLPVDRDRLATLLGSGPYSRPERLLELLARPRRRTVLSVLEESGATPSLDDLAADVLAGERGIPADDVPARDRQRVVTELRHSHLPAMDDVGVLEYDRSTGEVTYRGHPALAQ